MKVQYFEDTDTLYIELRSSTVVETRDIDENTLVDLDAGGQMVAITVEHAKQRAEVDAVHYERIPA